MAKKKWKKKYKKLNKRYYSLFCDNIRLRAEIEGNDNVKFMTDEQILYYKGVISKFGENIKKAFENIGY